MEVSEAARRGDASAPHEVLEMMMRRLTIAAAAAIVLAACADANALKRASDVGVATAPSVEWKPAPSEVPSSPKTTAVDVPDALRQPGAVVTLAQAIDVALRNNPATRAAWMRAKAAEDEVGVRRAAYWPEIDLNAQFVRQKSPNTGQRVPEAQTFGAPSIALNYLLFDFGGRSSQLEQARADLIAADFAHNATIQNVVLRVAQAYYDYLNSTSLLGAQRSTLAEMQANYEAAEARHNAGVATIADVLQAKTALSQAQLAILSLEGDVKIVQGALATAAGLPPTALFDVGVLPVEIPTKEISRQVDELIARAETDRPDLLSMRARAESAHARIAEMKSEGLPTVSLAATAARNYYGGSIGDSNSYLAGVQVKFPAFTGWRNTYDVRQAEADAAAADADALTFQQQIDLQVWTSYYGLKTATRRVEVSRDLLASAQESEKVAAGRYKEGVGSILDLLTAQAALANARAQEVAARGDWYLSLAQLAHDVGSMDIAALAATPTETK